MQLTNQRPEEHIAEKAIKDFLINIYHSIVHFTMIEDGEFNWAFWIEAEDTTSYLHSDLKVEWYGSSFNSEE